MPAKMGINGFGRIGRLVFRAAMANPEVEVYLCDVLCAAAFSEIFVFGFGFCALGPGMFIGDRGSISSTPLIKNGFNTSRTTQSCRLAFACTFARRR